MKHPIVLSLACALLLAILPSVASAGCSSTVCTAPVEKLVLWEGGDISIQQVLSASERAVMENAGTCVFGGGTYIVLRRGHASFQEIYALLVMTKFSGAEVSLRVKPTPSASCEVSYVVTK